MRRCLLLIVFAVVGPIAFLPATPDDDAVIARIAGALAQIGATWRDFNCHSEFRILSAEGALPRKAKRNIAPLITLAGNAEFRIWAKKPDKVRIEIIRSSLPMLDGMVFVQNGATLGAYDSLSMRTVTSDLTKLLGAQPNKMDTSFGIIDYVMNLAHYDVKLHGSVKLGGVDCYRLDLTSKRATGSVIMGAGVSRQVLYVEKKRLAPVREDLYGLDGKLLMQVFCKDTKQVKPGVWAPMTVVARDVWDFRAVIHCEWIGSKALFPTTIEMYVPGAKEPNSRARHREVRLDTAIPDSMFVLPK